MDIGDQFSLEHLLFKERVCRICGEKKILIEDFYLTRKNKRGLPSAYSYECKDCTVTRVMDTRKKKDPSNDWGYPDW
ncbi:endonuclease VII [Synechococcus phage ACG-2014h]|uniref:Endonuclease VII n=1 Tax=Synechococcus phage ACG-2014h TaxID=1340810 RepID=V5UT50_9CAUD|nr:endonuclease VII [Synechococcus phage ACG-2014h]AHB80520.1 hypothetical protein S-MbCM7_106 [Synechococcus phage ACG-2014h]